MEESKTQNKPLPFKLKDIQVGATVRFACGNPPAQIKGEGILEEAPFLDESREWVFKVIQKDAKIPDFLYANEIVEFSNKK